MISWWNKRYIFHYVIYLNRSNHPLPRLPSLSWLWTFCPGGKIPGSFLPVIHPCSVRLRSLPISSTYSGQLPSRICVNDRWLLKTRWRWHQYLFKSLLGMKFLPWHRPLYLFISLLVFGGVFEHFLRRVGRQTDFLLSSADSRYQVAGRGDIVHTGPKSLLWPIITSSEAPIFPLVSYKQINQKDLTRSWWPWLLYWNLLSGIRIQQTRLWLFWLCCCFDVF